MENSSTLYLKDLSDLVLNKKKFYFSRLYRNEEYVMEYHGPKTEKHLIQFVTSVNAKGPTVIEDIRDINKLVHNSTDKFFISFAFKVIHFFHFQNQLPYSFTEV